MSSGKKPSKDVEVHVCRFIDYKPSSICAAHLHPDNKHCAIGRENGNIEIWDLNGSFIQRTIPGKGANTVQSLLWIHDPNPKNKTLRLISAGLNGWITEWDLESLSIRSKISCHGYGIWSIAQSSITQTGDILISAACDDSKLRIYRLTQNEFIFQCEFITSGRCLSTIWSQTSYNTNESIMVYAGTSNGLIFGYDIISRQQMSNIVVAPPAVGGVRKKGATKPLIWSLCSMPQLKQIACSTSRGSVDIFDVEFGTLIQSINAAKNDIFSLKYVHSDKDNVLVAGCCDGRVLQFSQRNTNAMKNDFVLTGYHRYHTHDVNVVSITNSKVISGGIDCQLISCNTRDFWTHFIRSPLSNANASSNVVQVAHDIEWIKDVLPCNETTDEKQNKLSNKLFLHQKDRMMELWYMYQSKPIKIMDIRVGFTEFNISCAAISNDGKWIAVSNNQCIKLWKVVIAHQSMQLEKVFETTKRGSTTIKFDKNNKYLFLTPNVHENKAQAMDEDHKMNAKDIGDYLDQYQDHKANIIRINLDKVMIDKTIHLETQIGHFMISSLNLNDDASLCSIIVPSRLYGAVIHIVSGKIFYQIPKGTQGNNISCIEFQKSKRDEKSSKTQEVLYVVYANNAIKMFYYDYYKQTNKLFGVRNNIRLHLWCASNSKIWGFYNKNNPFSFTKILFNPSTTNKALLLRPEYMFSLVLNKKLPDSHFAGVGSKRTFGMMDNEGKGSDMDAKRMRIDQLIPSPFGKPQGGGKDKKNTKKKKLSFLRVIRKYDPIICAEFMEGNTLLIVHAPWHKVSASFKRPLYRKKYGI
eukprot:62184_1